AKYFDANGWFYFTKEVFDLFYPSYGDTYPTYNGGVGMTYEQGGSGRAGLGVITGIGDTLTLKDRIAHHHTTGLSTVEVATKNAERLNEEFKKFYRNKNFKYKSYVLSGNQDKLEALTRLLDQHEIEYGMANGNAVKGLDYKTLKNTTMRSSANSLVVSTDQTKGTLVTVLFEPNAKLSDSLTYDITAWSLPYAYGLNAVASETPVSATKGKKDGATIVTVDEDAYSYITDWNSMDDARFLADLLYHKIRVRYALKPFKTAQGNFERGSLIITKADNKHHKAYAATLTEAATKHHKTLVRTNTGFVDGGKDFGSRYVQMIDDVKVAVLAGEPTSTLQFGEIWHFFEQQLHYPVTILDSEYWSRVDLSEYDVLVLPDGYGYNGFIKEDQLQQLKEWVAEGGKLIAMGGAIQGLVGDKGFDIKARKKEKEKDSIAIEVQSYDAGQRESMKESITGAIFKTKVDPTHPLAYGYDDTYFSLKLGEDAYEYLKEGTVVYLENETKPVAGFAGSEVQKKIGKTMIFGVEEHGRGQVIYMVDNPLFRGFWENGKLFFANAVFMVN
ncbi:MAG: zinc carboxypeptidase, partial [Flavobacteriaceae bacterium]